MDKAYDAESIHRFIVEDLKAEALIPARNSSRMSYPDYTEAEHMTDSIPNGITNEPRLRQPSPS